MNSDYLETVVSRRVRVLRVGGAGTVTGTLKGFDDLGVVIVYQVQERVPGGAPMSTGRWIDKEAFVPFATIDRVIAI